MTVVCFSMAVSSTLDSSVVTCSTHALVPSAVHSSLHTRTWKLPHSSRCGILRAYDASSLLTARRVSRGHRHVHVTWLSYTEEDETLANTVYPQRFHFTRAAAAVTESVQPRARQSGGHNDCSSARGSRGRTWNISPAPSQSDAVSSGVCT